MINIQINLQRRHKKRCDTPLFHHFQGQMAARGTYSELQVSGLDFTTLLAEKEDEEEGRQGTTPIPVSRCAPTLSDNSISSMSSLSSSRGSLMEGAEPLSGVGVFELLYGKLKAFRVH